MDIKKRAREMAGNVYRMLTLHLEYPRLYRKEAARPVKKNKVVFLEVRQSELTDSFTQVYRALEAQGGYELKTVCIREGMQRRQAVRRNCLAAIPEVADAGTIFINDSCYFLSSLPLRPETTVIQLWHACGAFKKFGHSTANKKFGASSFTLKHFPVHKNFTYVTVSSPEVRPAYAEAFHMPKEQILSTGVSRTDVFYDQERITAAGEKLTDYLRKHGIGAADAPNRKVVLYAPTFRGRVADAVSPDVLDLTALHEALGDDWIFVMKHHPFVKHPPVIPEACRSYAVDASADLEIEELLMAADVCISDYSSLIFEYSLLERPMLFLDYDLEEYYDWRGFYFPLEELTPGPVVRNTEEVIDYLAHLPERFDREQVQAFRERFMRSCDGRATERILELMRSGQKS